VFPGPPGGTIGPEKNPPRLPGEGPSTGRATGGGIVTPGRGAGPREGGPPGKAVTQLAARRDGRSGRHRRSWAGGGLIHRGVGEGTGAFQAGERGSFKAFSCPRVRDQTGRTKFLGQKKGRETTPFRPGPRRTFGLVSTGRSRGLFRGGPTPGVPRSAGSTPGGGHNNPRAPGIEMKRRRFCRGAAGGVCRGAWGGDPTLGLAGGREPPHAGEGQGLAKGGPSPRGRVPRGGPGTLGGDGAPRGGPCTHHTHNGGGWASVSIFWPIGGGVTPPAGGR